MSSLEEQQQQRRGWHLIIALQYPSVEVCEIQTLTYYHSSKKSCKKDAIHSIREKKICINFSVRQSFSRFLSSSLCSCEGGCVVPNLNSRGLWTGVCVDDLMGHSGDDWCNPVASDVGIRRQLHVGKASWTPPVLALVLKLFDKMAKKIKRLINSVVFSFNTVLIHIGFANSGLSEFLQVSHLNFWLLMTLLTQRIQLFKALKLHGGWYPSHGYHFLAGDFSNGASSHPSYHQPFEFFHSEAELGRVSSSFLAFFFFFLPLPPTTLQDFFLSPPKTSHLDAFTSSRRECLLDFFLASSSGIRLIFRLNPRLIFFGIADDLTLEYCLCT